MHVRLAVFHDKSRIREVVLRRDTVIGRSRDCNVRIPVEEVSRHHCQITLGGSDILLRDLGSANGTLLDGHVIPANEDVVLASGNAITVGPVRLVVHLDEKNSLSPDCVDSRLDETAEFPAAQDIDVDNELSSDVLSEDSAIDNVPTVPIASHSGDTTPVSPAETSLVAEHPSSDNLHEDRAPESALHVEDSAIELELAAEPADEEFTGNSDEAAALTVEDSPEKSRSLFGLFRRRGRTEEAETDVDDDELVETTVGDIDEDTADEPDVEHEDPSDDQNAASPLAFDDGNLDKPDARKDIVQEAEDSVVFDFLPADDVVTDDLDEDDLSSFFQELD